MFIVKQTIISILPRRIILPFSPAAGNTITLQRNVFADISFTFTQKTILKCMQELCIMYIYIYMYIYVHLWLHTAYFASFHGFTIKKYWTTLNTLTSIKQDSFQTVFKFLRLNPTEKCISLPSCTFNMHAKSQINCAIQLSGH